MQAVKQIRCMVPAGGNRQICLSSMERHEVWAMHFARTIAPCERSLAREKSADSIWSAPPVGPGSISTSARGIMSCFLVEVSGTFRQKVFLDKVDDYIEFR
jgi:hypothetical protein